MYKFILNVVLVLSLGACSKPLKDLSYFKNGASAEADAAQYKEPVISKGDILSIIILSDNPKASELFNLPNVQTPNSQATLASLTNGYLVDEQGNIQIYQMGDVHAEGKTKFELTTELKGKLASYLQNPIVNIRMLNFKITVLGEVNRPGSFSIPNERVNVLEALGLAGDLTIFGERKTVKIIRNEGLKNNFITLDLTDKNIFSSPYFNLRQNDVVYVDVNPRKINNTDQTLIRNVGIAASFISSIAFIITVLRR